MMRASADAVRGRLVATLRELVAIDSTSTKPNRAMIDYLEPRLAALGFRCERHRYVDEAGVEKINLVAGRGEGHPELALVGHSDCVPYDEHWADALRLVERDGKLYGRGACDTKGFIAAALVSLERVPLSELQSPQLVLFTADEEVGCYGAKQLVEKGIGRARYAIIGEPTSLRPIRANKGYCLADVEVVGREGHSAYPDLGVNAIFHAARFLRRLEEAARTELRHDQDPLFDPPFTTVNVGVIQGGKAKNIIPGSCRFVVEWRPIPRQPVDVGSEMIHRIAAELRREDPQLDIRIRVVRADAGVDTSPQSEVVRFLEQQSGRASNAVSFGTEAPELTQLGAEAVVFGPGDIRVAHRTGEYVPIEELVRCEAILERALLHFCGRGGSDQPAVS
jgi:acetylornithine deacetylase